MANYQARSKQEIAQRIAQDIHEGAYVNLGIGMPTLVANYLPADREIILHSENGILGMGPAPAEGDEDYDLINAGKQPAIGARQTWVMTTLLTRNGTSKIVDKCTYPLTGIGCVSRVYTDLATLACTPQGLQLIDLVDGLEKAELERIVGLPIADAA
jgi:3-oxoadipate CoA-transferase beta subunit